MEHNEQLIDIIKQLNAKDAKKTNTIKKEITDCSYMLKTYLSKFKTYKEKASQGLKDQDEALKILDEINESKAEESTDYEKYSRNDSRVFTNKAKKEETAVTGARWKQYSNTKANLASDRQMSPLRLMQYSSDK